MPKYLLKTIYLLAFLLFAQLFYFIYAHLQQTTKYENVYFSFNPNVFSNYAKKEKINLLLPNYSQYEVKEYYDLKPLQESTSSSEKDKFFYFVENNKNFLFRTDEQLNMTLLIQNIEFNKEINDYLNTIKTKPDLFKSGGLFFDKSLIYKDEKNYHLTLSYKKDVGLFNKFFALFFERINHKEMITIKVSNGIVEFRYQNQNKPIKQDFVESLFFQNSFLTLFN